tara:strand:+ start:90 stop:296 length:207 start_codon:yes stop_codon:yes gene_type:complete
MKYNDLSKEQKEYLRKKLLNTDNINDFLKVLQNDFDLVNCRSGNIVKQILANNIVNVVLPMINPTKNE